MRLTFALAFCGIGTLLVCQPAAAQDAAETGAIMSGTGQATTRGAGSLGSAIDNAMQGMANRMNQATQARRAPPPAQASPSSPEPATFYYGPRMTSVPDVLKHTGVPAYRLGNGMIIRVSGAFDANPAIRCVRNCPAS